MPSARRSHLVKRQLERQPLLRALVLLLAALAAHVGPVDVEQHKGAVVGRDRAPLAVERRQVVPGVTKPGGLGAGAGGGVGLW
jgi:hypothetical protein